jgi:type I restriction enzyme S subunit
VKRPPREDDGVVTAFRDGEVTLRSNRRTDGFTNAIQEAGYQGVRSGDLVIHAMDAFAGAIGVSDSDGKSTPVYSVCSPISSDTNTSYYGKLLRHMALSGFVNALAKGIRERSTEFRWADASDVLLPVPTKQEQRQINDFLDREVAKIDALVEEQRRLIDLLKEKRQAVISQAVTKGLSPDVPMKDSGVEWLSEIPEHWQSLQLGRVCRQVSDGPHFSPQYVEDGVMFLSARNLSVASWHLEDAKFISEADYLEFCKRVTPEIGDVLYTKGGTTGIARVVDLSMRFQVWVHIAVLKLDRDKVDPYFLAYALNSVGCYEQSQLSTRGATNQDLGLTRMIRIWLALPPLTEQKEIAARLRRETERVDALVAESESALSLLQERRSALISAAVTGKIDVRGLVPQSEVVAA